MFRQRRRLTEEETHPADEQQVTQDTPDQTALHNLKLALDQGDDRDYETIPTIAVCQSNKDEKIRPCSWVDKDRYLMITYR
jgi:hypothetical protein